MALREVKGCQLCFTVHYLPRRMKRYALLLIFSWLTLFHPRAARTPSVCTRCLQPISYLDRSLYDTIKNVRNEQNKRNVY